MVGGVPGVVRVTLLTRWGVLFSFPLSFFRFLFGVFGAGWVSGCLGMWGRVMFALVGAFCVFRGGWLFVG